MIDINIISFYSQFDRLIFVASLINGIQTNQNQLIERTITCFSENYSKRLNVTTTYHGT